MALVVETGLGVSGANTFADVASANAYFTTSGETAWAGEDAAKEAALVRAGRYLNGLCWQGDKVDRVRQAMCWPRYNVPLPGSSSANYLRSYYADCWPSNEIPDAILQAQCEAALRYLTGTEMLPDLERGGQVFMERVDVITTQYASGAPAGTRFLAVEALLRPFLKSSASVDLVRG
jgi:hypothetical protein